jgi:hypothetical protein
VEGINSMMPLVAILVVFGGFMAFDQNLPETWVLIFGVIGTVVTALDIAGFFLIDEVPAKTEGNENYLRNLTYGFRPNVIRNHAGFYLTLLAYAVFNISIQIYMPYLILYYSVSLGMENYVLIFAPAIILAAAFTFFYGNVYDKKGFTGSVFTPIILLMSGYTVLYFCKDMIPVFLGTLIMLSGYLSGMGIFGAMLRDKTPEGKAGMFQGQRIIGQVLIPGVIGPAIGAWVLRDAEQILNSDGTYSFVPNENIFLAAFIAAIFIWIMFLPLFRQIRKEN